MFGSGILGVHNVCLQKKCSQRDHEETQKTVCVTQVQILSQVSRFLPLINRE